MKWGAMSGITFIVILMALFEWPKMDRQLKREKAAFAVLLCLGWVLAMMLVIFPNLPGPTQLVDAVFKPLGKLLKK